MPMKLIETTISETAIRVRLSDGSEDPKEWLDFQVPLSPLMSDEINRLGDPAVRPLSIIQRAALLYVQDVIDEEIQRASGPQRPFV